MSDTCTRTTVSETAISTGPCNACVTSLEGPFTGPNLVDAPLDNAFVDKYGHALQLVRLAKQAAASGR